MTDKPKLPEHHKQLSKCCNAPVDMYSGFASTIEFYCNACKKLCFVYDNRYKLPEKIDVKELDKKLGKLPEKSGIRIDYGWKEFECMSLSGSVLINKTLIDKINAIISYLEEQNK